jgi:hypothetical protein
MPHIRRMASLLIILFGASLATAMVWKPAPRSRYAGLSGRDVPRSLGGYAAASDDPISPEVQAALASADILSRTYRYDLRGPGIGKETVNFTLIGGTDRSALHDPRSCLIGAGMQLQNDHLERLPGTNVTARVCYAVPSDKSNANSYDLIYLYVIHGKVVTQVTQIRAAMLESALLGQRGVPVYFLRFTRSLNGSDFSSEARSHARMQQFAAVMWKCLQSKLSSTDQVKL